MSTPPPPASARWLARLRDRPEIERVRRHEDSLLLVVTLLTGAVVGLVVVGFIVVTERLGARLYPSDAAPWRRLMTPMIGALVSGLLLARHFPDARGSGIPQTKVALFLRDGYITFRTVFGKFLCSSISLASGIALGREGPTVHVGAGVASVVGRRLGLGPRRVQALIPIGTSAAVAAAFNTPIAGVLFTLEEILGDLHARVLGSVVISAATSWAILHLMLGDEPLFHVPAYQLVHPIELPLYAVLGVAGGLVSVAFVKLLLRLRAGFLRLPPATRPWQPLAGGLAVGLLGWFVPEVLGVGYAHVGEALNGKLLLGGMALLLLLKVFATAACYASGNAGGIFGPSLFLGAMLGGTLGTVAHSLFPDVTGSPGAYALVGMGAAFAGIVRAPMTSVIMIFEITRDYSIIVPVMIANLLSFFISQRLQPRPIYEALLHQDGVRLPPSRVALEGVTVGQAMRNPSRTLPAATRVAEQRDLADRQNDDGPWPVADGDGFLGMVTRAQLREAERNGQGAAPLSVLVGSAGAHDASLVPYVHMDEPAEVALHRMGSAGVNVLPVVSRSDVRQLVGIIALADLPGAYQRRSQGRPPDEAPAEAIPVRRLLAAVLLGVLGLFLLGGFLTRQYYVARSERAARFSKAGLALLQEKRFSEAAEQLRTALSLTRSERDRLALGLALAGADRGAEARVYLDQVLERDADNGPANLAIARLENRAGNIEGAATAYRRAIEGTPPAGDDAVFELVALLQKAGQARQGIGELLRLAGRAREPATLIRISRRLLQLGAPQEAAELLRDVLRSVPGDAAGHALLGEAELASGSYRSARSAFLEAVRRDPASAAYRDRLSLIERVLALDPNARGLRSAERFARTRQLVAEVLSSLEACAPQPYPPARLDLAQRARAVLSLKRTPRSPSDAAEANLQLAEELWSEHLAACSQPPEEALRRVFARLEREGTN